MVRQGVRHNVIRMVMGHLGKHQSFPFAEHIHVVSANVQCTCAAGVADVFVCCVYGVAMHGTEQQ